LLIDVADLLVMLHASHVVHRDLKPDNVMVRRGRQRDEAVLIDFGIALVGGEPDLLQSYGTVGYMAPEQASGDGKVDGSADIYSLGKMILEVWSGGRAPEPLGGIVAQMLDEEPAKRPPLDEVKAALGSCWEALKS
jgi:serine/threonine protein kinase